MLGILPIKAVPTKLNFYLPAFPADLSLPPLRSLSRSVSCAREERRRLADPALAPPPPSALPPPVDEAGPLPPGLELKSSKLSIVVIWAE